VEGLKPKLSSKEIANSCIPEGGWSACVIRTFRFCDRRPFGNYFGVSIQGKKVVKLPEGLNPGFPHMDGKIIEFGRYRCKCGYLISFIATYARYGLKLTSAGKGPELGQVYVKGLDGSV
jgi:hypothetical protein